MREFTIYVKMFLKNKLLAITSAVFLTAVLGLQILEVTMVPDAVGTLQENMTFCIFYFIFFLFISYEYFFKTRASGFEECVRTTGKYLTLYGNQFFVLILLDGIVFFILSLFGVISCSLYTSGHMEFLGHLLANYFLNVFVLNLLGIVLALFVSLVFKRLIGYLVLTFFVWLTSPYFYSVALSFMSNKRVNIFPIYEFFNIYSPALNWKPNYQFGFSLLPYRIEQYVIWLALFMALVLFVLSFRRHQNALRGVSAALAVIVIGNAVLYFQPSSKYNMNFNPDGSLWSDSYYYEEYDARDSVSQTTPRAADFEATAYVIDIKVRNQLEATVKVRLTEPKTTVDTDTYIFTLYHGFKIKSIRDQDGNELPFNQKDDFITVANKRKDVPVMKELTFCYSGYHAKYYSNTQAICLPGHMVYYPIPGHVDLYDSERDVGLPTLLPKPIPFEVTVDYHKKVYCSLFETEENTFRGTTDGVTLLSGMLTTRTVEGIEIVYPYMDIDQGGQEIMERDVAEFLAAKAQANDTSEVKKIMYLPSMNFQETERAVQYSDHIATIQIRTLDALLYGMEDTY